VHIPNNWDKIDMPEEKKVKAVFDKSELM